MDILTKLFGSAARIKIMKLFLLNKGSVFSAKEISKRVLVNIDSTRKELKILSSIGFIKEKKGSWSFSHSFKYSDEIEALLIGADTVNKQNIGKMIKTIGNTKLIVLSGIFLKAKDSRVDLLVVGDKIKKSKLEDIISKIESELGREIIYALFDTNEFIYRLNMYDKLIRDILDFQNEIIYLSKEFSTIDLKKR